MKEVFLTLREARHKMIMYHLRAVHEMVIIRVYVHPPAAANLRLLQVVAVRFTVQPLNNKILRITKKNKILINLNSSCLINTQSKIKKSKCPAND